MSNKEHTAIHKRYRQGGTVGRKQLNRIGAMLDNWHLTGGLRGKITPYGITLDGGGGFPWSKMAFGYKFSATNKITVYAGEIQVADNTPAAAAETELTVSVDGSYIYAEYNWSTETLTLKNNGSTKPVSTGALFRRWLYLVAFTDSRVSLTTIGHMGNIMIPATYGG